MTLPAEAVVCIQTVRERAVNFNIIVCTKAANGRLSVHYIYFGERRILWD